MPTLLRADSTHPDFVALVRQLDADLALRDGDEHAFYAQFNTIATIKHVVIAYNNGSAVACGAIKAFDEGAMEVKRMFVVPAARNQGFAAQVLSELENWAASLGYTRCMLETGRKQPEAIALYTKCGYLQIPNYGQYAGVSNSVCFEKTL
ncbi:GNAT family N-acetyltransferase [Cytophagales bacterium LB-30]|uniref:GNAT family N-acetyltransferase n=1 Tax=Shiella aurantiaca TaxID=3058365 RepID=A0ABT8F6H3_9BACT|nr:GNAT family N-acetyltransferase [Shiella aurantiaca]MDN4165964.1 GNAT family N-acetyltransferase [Shiella aurantiaca]